MRRSIPALFILACSLVAPEARSGSILRHGLTCQPTRGDEPHLGYTSWGVGNYSAARRAAVFCPAHDVLNLQASTPGVDDDAYVSTMLPRRVNVHVADSARLAPLFCQLLRTDVDTGTWWGPRRYSCSVPGGCPDETSTYEGRATIALDEAHGHADPSIQFGVYCSLPAAEPDPSWIMGMTSEAWFW